METYPTVDHILEPMENGKKWKEIVTVNFKVIHLYKSVSDFCPLHYCCNCTESTIDECFMFMINSSLVDLERFLSGTFKLHFLE